MNSTMTVKGQVTIPKRLRDYLGLAPGDRVRFEYGEDGSVRIVAPRAPARRRSTRGRFAALRGARSSGMTTDEIMNLLRDYDGDAADPGFGARRR